MVRIALPAPCVHCPLRLDQLAWMRVNRLLAWALLISPAVQVAWGADFWRGLWLDFAILCAHAGLSLALFGVPKGLTRMRLWSGGAPDGARSARTRFLLSAWRMFLTLLYTPAVFFVQWPLLLAGLPMPLLFVPLLPLWAMLPLRIIGHVYAAGDYAYRRWGVRDASGRTALGLLVVVLFLAFSTMNLLR